MEFMRALAKQNVFIRGGRSLVTQLLGAGEYHLQIVAYWYRPYLMKKQGAPVDWIGIEPAIVALHPISIVERSPHPNAARLYVDHMLSEEIQRDYIVGKFFKISARQGIKNAIQQKFANVKMIPIDITQAEHLDKHEKRYREIFLSGR
jgi:ABC-type Fe3+ transport system substrate-binding protein